MALKQVEIYFITPKEATNLITNPTPYSATTGYTATGTGVSIARVTTYQRRGPASIEITTASNQPSGLYYAIALTSGTQYSFSADVLDVNGQSFSIFFADTSGNVQGTATTWTGTGHWVRKSVTWTATSSATFRLYIVRASVASTTKYYTDGWQLETGTVSTYFDGSMVGFNRLRKDYVWNGTAYASTSYRSGKTRSGGYLVRLRDYASLLGTVGLGMMSLTNNMVPVSGAGSYYTGTYVPNREYQVSVRFSGTEHEDVLSARNSIISAIRPDNVPGDEPLVVRWQLEDENGNPISYPLDSVSVYEGGLEHNTTGMFSQFEDKATMRFKSFLPFLQADGQAATALGYTTTVSNFANIGYRDTDGTWKAMGTGANDEVHDIRIGPNGMVYACGVFTSMGGVANTNHIAGWNGSAWTALDTGLTNAAYHMDIGPDGGLYTIDGTAIKKWSGSAWSTIGTSDVQASDLRFGPDGNLYIVGPASVGAVTINGVGKWDGSVWTAVGNAGTGVGAPVVVGTNNYIYIDKFIGIGDYDLMQWNGSAWSKIADLDNSVTDAVVGTDGAIYFAGSFTTVNGAAMAYLTKWNGTKFESVGQVIGNDVDAIALSPSGGFYIGGVFSQIGTSVFPDRMAYLFNNTFLPFDVDVQDDSAFVYAITCDALHRVYIGGNWSGTDALSATVTAANPGTSKSHPRVVITGPGTLWQVKNYTTGKAVYFGGLTLLAGETVTLDLRPGHLSFTSSFRGNLTRYILAGSDLDFPLLPGNNNVSAFMTGTTAASTITMYYTNYYWSYDGAAW